MRVAIIANSAWLDEDLTMFHYLVVGLLDQQVQVAQVVPKSLAEDESSVFGDRVTWQESSWPWIQERRLWRLADRLDELGVDLLHAVDGQAWDGALRLANQLKIPVVLGTCTALDLPRVRKLGQTGEHAPVAFVASTGPLGDAVRQNLSADALVEVLPPGVHIPQTAQPLPAEQDKALCSVVSGNGRHDPEYEALMAAIHQCIQQYPQAQFFFDGQGTDQHAIWQAGERHGLLANMSLLPRRLGHREILLRADLLIHPQALGRSRSLTLQAMAHGLPVIAQQDPWLDYLIDDQTAWVVDQPDTERWTNLIRQVVEMPAKTQQLAQRARQWVSQRHLASLYVDRTLALYRQVSGESLKFPHSPPSPGVS